MCLGGICSCAYTWHYDSEYRSERVLAVQTCIFVDFVCFQNMNSNKLCVYQAFRHICFGGACMFISRTERYSRTYSLLKGHASNMLWMCVCVFTRHSDLHVLAELKVYSRQLRADIYVAELL